MAQFSRAAPMLMLVGVTAVWGWTFVLVRDAIATYPVVPFLALRFTLAALLLLPFVARGSSGVRAGVVPGAVLGLGYLFQTIGLQHTSAAKAGLLTGLLVIFTPLLGWLLYGEKPAAITRFAAGTAFAGTGMLALGGSGLGISGSELFGDSLEVLTAICFAIHVLLLGRVSARCSSGRLAFGQMMAAAALFFAGTGFTGFPGPPPPHVSFALLVTGGLASALAFWVQTLVQQRVEAARTAIILVMEPAFATLFGFLLAGERFGPVQAVGAAFIFGALIVHESVPLVRPMPEARAAGL